MNRWVHLLVALLFFVFAVVQWNDPDALIWIPVYVVVGSMAILAFYGRYYRWPYLLVTTGIVLWMASYIPKMNQWISMGMPNIVESMRAEAPHIEWTREFFGLLICFAAAAYYYLRAKISKDDT